MLAGRRAKKNKKDPFVRRARTSKEEKKVPRRRNPLHMRKKCARIRTEKEGTATAAYPLMNAFIKSRSLFGVVGGSFFWSKDVTNPITRPASLARYQKKMPHSLKNSAY